ncbi:histidine phosphatase family protein [Lysinibacillus sp. NPDC097195]|uniref:histidine phosphatase family protein n=1 Tax=Lysinibacillus sp. NPDC097195 TaxID=3364141 RepID=UPI00380545B5
MADIVTVRLMRHAPTQENMEKRYIGWTDSPLAQIVSLPIVDLAVKKVYGSDLRRCQQTASCYFPHARYMADARFRETNFGDFECKTYDELKTDERYCKWLDDPLNTSPPNGERFDLFCQRVVTGFLALPKEEDDYYLVVHGGVVRALLVAFAPQQKPFWSYQVPHDRMFTLTFSKAAWKEGARCMSLSEEPITEKTPM